MPSPPTLTRPLTPAAITAAATAPPLPSLPQRLNWKRRSEAAAAVASILAKRREAEEEQEKQRRLAAAATIIHRQSPLSPTSSSDSSDEQHSSDDDFISPPHSLLLRFDGLCDEAEYRAFLLNVNRTPEEREARYVLALAQQREEQRLHRRWIREEQCRLRRRQKLRFAGYSLHSVTTVSNKDVKGETALRVQPEHLSFAHLKSLQAGNTQSGRRSAFPPVMPLSTPHSSTAVAANAQILNLQPTCNGIETATSISVVDAGESITFPSVIPTQADNSSISRVKMFPRPPPANTKQATSHSTGFNQVSPHSTLPPSPPNLIASTVGQSPRTTKLESRIKSMEDTRESYDPLSSSWLIEPVEQSSVYSVDECSDPNASSALSFFISPVEPGDRFNTLHARAYAVLLKCQARGWICIAEQSTFQLPSVEECKRAHEINPRFLPPQIPFSILMQLLPWWACQLTHIYDSATLELLAQFLSVLATCVRRFTQCRISLQTTGALRNLTIICQALVPQTTTATLNSAPCKLQIRAQLHALEMIDALVSELTQTKTEML